MSNSTCNKTQKDQSLLFIAQIPELWKNTIGINKSNNKVENETLYINSVLKAKNVLLEYAKNYRLKIAETKFRELTFQKLSNVDSTGMYAHNKTQISLYEIKDTAIEIFDKIKTLSLLPIKDEDLLKALKSSITDLTDSNETALGPEVTNRILCSCKINRNNPIDLCVLLLFVAMLVENSLPPEETPQIPYKNEQTFVGTMGSLFKPPNTPRWGGAKSRRRRTRRHNRKPARKNK